MRRPPLKDLPRFNTVYEVYNPRIICCKYSKRRTALNNSFANIFLQRRRLHKATSFRRGRELQDNNRALSYTFRYMTVLFSFQNSLYFILPD